MKKTTYLVINRHLKPIAEFLYKERAIKKMKVTEQEVMILKMPEQILIDANFNCIHDIGLKVCL